MDKGTSKKAETVSTGWLRRALNSSEVFSHLLQLYDYEQGEKLITSILRALDETSVEQESTIYVKGESSKYVYFIR